jgi:hypothetical protein
MLEAVNASENDGQFIPDYTAQHPLRYTSSNGHFNCPLVLLINLTVYNYYSMRVLRIYKNKK